MRVQAQIRHKRCPLRATPIYTVLSLSSLEPERCRGDCVLLLILLARYSLSKIKNKTHKPSTEPSRNQKWQKHEAQEANQNKL